MIKKIAIPLLIFAFGLFSLYWAQMHSPDANLAEKAARELQGSYTLSTPGYIFSLIFGTALVVIGGRRVFKHIKK